MSKKIIILYKPRFMVMTVKKNKSKLLYSWRKQTLDLDYFKCQSKVKQLSKKVDFNMNHYFSFVKLSPQKYYQTMKKHDDNPITNFKIRLIYLKMLEDYERVRTQYILTYYILKTEIVSIDDYVNISQLSKKSIRQFKNEKNQIFYYDTFQKMEVANLKIQKEILAHLKKMDIKRYNKLASLSMIDFFQYYKPVK